MALHIARVKFVSVAVVAGALTLTGCSGHKGGDDGASPAPQTTAGATSSAAAADSPSAATNVPDGFPADVPILNGTVTGKSFDVPGTTGKMWSLHVTDVGKDAFIQAQQLLTDAGYKVDKEASAEPGCDMQSALSKDRDGGGGYTVVLCSQNTGDAARLSYSVNVYPESDWGTNLKPPPDVPVFPTAPK